jgi:hypothetical protein
MATAFTTQFDHSPMLNKTLLVVAASTFSLITHAAEPADNKRMFQARSKVCLAAAEAAKVVTTETMRAATFNPDAAIAKHSAPGSEVRQLLDAALGKDGAMRSVLIQSASFGAAMLPRAEQEDAKIEIATFAYTSLFNQCVIEAMLKYGY